IDLLEVLVACATPDDTELSGHARQTIREQDTETLNNLVRSQDIPVPVLTYLATVGELPRKIHESIISNAKTPITTIVQFAGLTKSPELLDAISLNQQLLIQNPPLIEAILRNPNRTSEAERRAAETKKEFFEKERGQQQIANELRAQGKEAAAEFIENLEFDGDITDDDALFFAEHVVIPDSETDDSWLGLEFIEEIY